MNSNFSFYREHLRMEFGYKVPKVMVVERRTRRLHMDEKGSPRNTLSVIMRITLYLIETKFSSKNIP